MQVEVALFTITVRLASSATIAEAIGGIRTHETVKPLYPQMYVSNIGNSISSLEIITVLSLFFNRFYDGDIK
jgi:hypothetical protein